jgi:hypothetical protein
MPIPSNLIPVNVSEISENVQSIGGEVSGNVQSLAGEISGNISSLDIEVPSTDLPALPEIPEYTILNRAIDSIDLTKIGLDVMERELMSQIKKYLDSLGTPDIVTRLSYGRIKNFISAKVDRLKIQRQRALSKALDEELRASANPFEYRKRLINTSQNTLRG